MKEFKYKTIFASRIKVLTSEEKDRYLAKASLEELRKFLPEMDIKANYDLLPFAMDAYVVNRANKNFDGVMTDEAIASYKNFYGKPVNVGHKRTSILGTILTVGFSEFGTSKPLEEKDVKDLKTPFNVTVGGVLWRLVSPELTELIEDSNDPESENYMKIAGSFEIGFQDYWIGLGEGDNRNTEDFKLISDAEEIKKLEKHLFAYGGNGKTSDGLKVYRILKGEILPLGQAVTESPAADVEGIAVPEKQQKTEETEAKSKESVIEIESKEKDEKQNISLSEKSNVNQNKNMKIKSLKDITDETLKEATAGDITKIIEQEMEVKTKEIVDKLTSKENEAKDAKAEAEKANKAVTELTEKYQALEEKYNTLIKAALTKENEDKFKVRMASLDEEFELTDADRAVIAKKIKDLDDAAYAEVKKDFDVLLSAKNKETIKAAQAKEVKKEAKAEETAEQKAAREKEETEKALEEARAKEEVPNAKTEQKSLKDKMIEAFSGDNVVINTNRRARK